MIAVADAAGSHWPDLARDACKALVAGADAADEDASRNIKLHGALIVAMINEDDDAKRVVLDEISCCAAEDRVYLLEVSAVCSCILAAAMDKVAQSCGDGASSDDA